MISFLNLVRSSCNSKYKFSYKVFLIVNCNMGLLTLSITASICLIHDAGRGYSFTTWLSKCLLYIERSNEGHGDTPFPHRIILCASGLMQKMNMFIKQLKISIFYNYLNAWNMASLLFKNLNQSAQTLILKYQVWGKMTSKQSIFFPKLCYSHL